MTETRIANNVAWHLKKEVKKIKQQGNKTPGDARIDAKFCDLCGYDEVWFETEKNRLKEEQESARNKNT